MPGARPGWPPSRSADSQSGRSRIARNAGLDRGHDHQQRHRPAVHGEGDRERGHRGERAEAGHGRRHEHVVTESLHGRHPAEVGAVDGRLEHRAEQHRRHSGGDPDRERRGAGQPSRADTEQHDGHALHGEPDERRGGLAPRRPANHGERAEGRSATQQGQKDTHGAGAPALLTRPQREADTLGGTDEQVEAGQGDHQGAGERLGPQVREPALDAAQRRLGHGPGSTGSAA